MSKSLLDPRIAKTDQFILGPFLVAGPDLPTTEEGPEELLHDTDV